MMMVMDPTNDDVRTISFVTIASPLSVGLCKPEDTPERRKIGKLENCLGYRVKIICRLRVLGPESPSSDLPRPFPAN